jgi:hypothetical protein
MKYVERTIDARRPQVGLRDLDDIYLTNQSPVKDSSLELLHYTVRVLMYLHPNSSNIPYLRKWTEDSIPFS